ncbi:hypothetical protein Tco_0774357 [Tanacetum coccineum]|uniref:Uncharacterized protein n=1 Tax=Tanacetum coccineum TaxID=301880 RepID=A0ABQ4ZQG4_9ASTR
MDGLSDGGWSNYVPHDEWKLLEFKRNNPIHAKQDCIGEYGVDDNDFEYMCDYLLSNDEPFTVSNEEGRLKVKCKLFGTPREQIANMEQEFDDWAMTNGNHENKKRHREHDYCRIHRVGSKDEETICSSKKSPYEGIGEDTKSIAECESDVEEQELDDQTDKTVNEWFKTKIKKYRRMQQKKDREKVTKEVPRSSIDEYRAIFAKGAQVDRTNELYEVSFVVDDDVLEWDIPSKFLPCQLPPKELNPGSFTLPCTIGSLNLYDMTDLGASINIMPRSIFKHLKLANLKKTDMLVEMADMTRKAPLGRPFLTTMHAHIDVFKRDISLGIGDDRVLFDMDGSEHHFKIHVEKVFYNNKCGKDYGMWPTCNPDLSFCNGDDDVYGKGVHGMLEQWMCFRDNERQSIEGNRIIFADFLKVRHGNKSVDDTTQERRYYEWVAQNSEFNDSDTSHEATMYDNPLLNERVLDSFDIETDYGRTRDDPYSRRFDEYKMEFDNEVEQLANEYDLRIGTKGYALDDVWEKCEKFHGDYESPFVDIKTFEIERYSFDGGRIFVCITKPLDDALPLGRVNESRFMGMIRKEMDEEGGVRRKT